MAACLEALLLVIDLVEVDRAVLELAREEINSQDREHHEHDYNNDTDIKDRSQ